jgi:hypothetical protein
MPTQTQIPPTQIPKPKLEKLSLDGHNPKPWTNWTNPDKSHPNWTNPKRKSGQTGQIWLMKQITNSKSKIFKFIFKFIYIINYLL